MPPPTEDRFSALPDEILRYILSFLPTKFAFTTSVLSKRWTPICYSLTDLHFDDEAEEDEETYLSFYRFLDTVLLSPRFQHNPIQTLSLMFRSDLIDNQFNIMDEWVEAAKQRGVMNLQLFTRLILPLPLSPSIFTSAQTLVVLKLRHLTVSHRVGSVDLPSLTTLHLIDVLFRKRDDLKKLLNGCPIVEDLYVVAHNAEDSYTTGYKTLPKVVKAHISAYNVPFRAINNVEFLHIEFQRRESDKFINSYYIAMPVFRNLICIELDFTCFLGWDEVVEVLSHCPKLQSLAIEKCGYRRHGKFYKKESVPECVSLHLKTCSIGNYQIKGMCDDFEFAAYILQNARVLQELTLHIHPFWNQADKVQFFKRLASCPKISPAWKIKIDATSS